MARDYIIKNSNGKDIVYKNVEKIALTDVNGNQAIFSEIQPELRNDGEYCIKVIDYDGTVIKEEWLNTGDVFEMPAIPAHEKLVFQEWVSTSGPISNSIVVSDSDILIGPIYETRSGLTEVDIVVDKTTGKDFSLYLNEVGTINWGDGTFTKSDGTGQEQYHTYTDYGPYTITVSIDNTDGQITIARTSHGGYIEDNFVREIRFAGNIKEAKCSMESNYYTNYYALSQVSLPKGLLSYFNDFDRSSQTLIIPQETIDVCFASNYGLKNLLMSSKNTYFVRFQNWMPMPIYNIVFPENYDFSRNNFCVYGFFKKVELKFTEPARINSFPMSVYDCVYDFSKCTIVPELNSSNIFVHTNAKNIFYKIIVPDELYDIWVSSSYWADMANKILKKSQMEE